MAAPERPPVNEPDELNTSLAAMVCERIQSGQWTVVSIGMLQTPDSIGALIEGLDKPICIIARKAEAR